ncbi:MAG: hypothetical protein AB1486_32495 [Planctomycetota bacterium]
MAAISITDLASALGAEADVLICSASFEHRCRTIPEHVDVARVGEVLVFQNRGLGSIAASNAKEIRNRFGAKARSVHFQGGNPLAFADAAQKALGALGEAGRRYLVDVSTFTRENLLILLSLLHQHRHKGDNVAIAYASAAEYMVNGEEWLSRGYGDVRSVLGYPGEMRPSLGEHLIVLVGFEGERAERLIRNYEPTMLALGHCKEFAAIAPHFHRKNLELHARLTQSWQRVGKFEFACDDPFAARDHILAEVGRYPDHNPIVAPMNTKLSTVGAALATYAEPRIQLCYVPAREYNQRSYSEPGQTCFLYELPL